MVRSRKSEDGTTLLTGITTTKAAHAGQAVYSPFTLALYDLAVLRISNTYIWKCPTDRMLGLYEEHATDEHLDVGVGTGWYLDHCRFPHLHPRIGLVDLNPSSLASAAKRIERYRPTSYQADILQPITVNAAPFRSISMTYLLHCLPGTMAEKTVTFDHLALLLAAGGVVFGATLLSQGVERFGAAKRLMRADNRRGIFSNEADSLDSLRTALSIRFTESDVTVLSSGALFVARAWRG